MNEPLSFELSLDPAETVRAAREVERRARTVGGRLLFMAAYAVPIVFALASGQSTVLLTVYIGLLIALGLWTLVSPAVRTRQVAKLYRATPALVGVQRCDFTDEGLTFSNAEMSNLVRWTAFIQAVETPEFFLLYYSPKSAYYFPRRIVAAQQKEDALRALLRSKLGPKAERILAPT